MGTLACAQGAWFDTVLTVDIGYLVPAQGRCMTDADVLCLVTNKNRVACV